MYEELFNSIPLSNNKCGLLIKQGGSLMKLCLTLEALKACLSDRQELNT